MDPRLATSLEGRYTIDREVGRGGMAVVYLARDVRHSRNVALKVLNAELGAVLGVERFLAEIQVTANLQHPHLLPLFDSGEAGGLLFYVMPYVEGESLRARLEREKQLPVEEAVRISTAIAGALDYAHRHNVIHRDLKPENILLQDGQPLIADFGIALAVTKAGGSRITQTGLSLGTPQYMSPEQATGDRVVDGRTDIYSLAAMTYEMLTGDPPHVASTAQAIIAKVLTEKPASIRTSRPNVPAHVDGAVSRALEKLAADRFATAHEFAEALGGRGATLATAAPSAASPGAGFAAQSVRGWQIAAGVLAVVAAGALWKASRTSSGAMNSAPVIRAILDLPAGRRINDALTGTTLAVSPKGDVIAYTAIGGNGFQTFIRRVGDLTARPLSDGNSTNIAGRNLTFSPDGRWLALTEGPMLRKVSIDGGQIMTIIPDLGVNPTGLSWGANDTIYVGSFVGMLATTAGGGKASFVGFSDSTSARAHLGQRWPLVMPGGGAVLYATGNSSGDPSRLAVLDLPTHESVVLDVTVAVPLGFLDDKLIYVAPGGQVMALQFDRAARKPVGEPVPIEDGVVADPTSGAKAALSASGTLLYQRGRSEFQAVIVGEIAAAVTPLMSELHVYSTPRYSPDGRRVAVSVVGAQSADIWIYDIGRNTFTRLTTEGSNLRPEWTPDGKRVLFRSERSGKVAIWWQPADGSGPAELLYDAGFDLFEAIMSPDSKWLVIRTAPTAKYPRDILAVPLEGERKIVPLVTSPFTESMPRLSPDGRWLAYQSNEGGNFQIYVRPFPASGARAQVSADGGTQPLWSRSGKVLYYRDLSDRVMAVNVTTGASFSVGERRVAVTGDYLSDASHPSYDVSPEGKFLMLKRAGAESQTIIVHNWIREMREKTAPKR